jgi:hypothetical protein
MRLTGAQVTEIAEIFDGADVEIDDSFTQIANYVLVSRAEDELLVRIFEDGRVQQLVPSRQPTNTKKGA